MTPVKIAVLEDDKEFLKEILDNLKRTGLVNILVAEQDSETFITKVREKMPDILLLDVKLEQPGEKRNGIQVAQLLKLPTIFFTGAKPQYTLEIDELKINSPFPVDENNKLPNEERLKEILKKFIPRVVHYQKSQKVRIKPKGEEEIMISPSDVAFIISTGGNHKIYFINRNPITVADKSLEYFITNGFSENKFYKLGRGTLLNIELTEYKDEKLNAPCIVDNGKKQNEKFDVPVDKRNEIKNIFLK